MPTASLSPRRAAISTGLRSRNRRRPGACARLAPPRTRRARRRRRTRPPLRASPASPRSCRRPDCGRTRSLAATPWRRPLAGWARSRRRWRKRRPRTSCSTGWRRWSARSPASAPQSRLAPCVSRSRFSPPARGASSSTASRPAQRGSMRRGPSSSTPAVSPPSPSFRRLVARPNGRSSRRSRRSARRSCARRGSRTGRLSGWRSRSAARWGRNDRGLSAR